MVQASVGGTLRDFKRSDQPFGVSVEEGQELLATGLFEVSETVKIRFKDKETSPKLHITQGPFRRTFIRAEQPFEVTRSDWEHYLEPVARFEAVQEMQPATQAQNKEKPKTPPSGTPDSGSDGALAGQ